MPDYTTSQRESQTRYTPHEAYYDLFFDGLDDLLREQLIRRAALVDIADLLSDNPHGVTITPQSVGNIIKRRLGGDS